MTFQLCQLEFEGGFCGVGLVEDVLLGHLASFDGYVEQEKDWYFWVCGIASVLRSYHP